MRWIHSLNILVSFDGTLLVKVHFLRNVEASIAFFPLNMTWRFSAIKLLKAEVMIRFFVSVVAARKKPFLRDLPISPATKQVVVDNCVGTRKHQKIRIDGFWCLIRVFLGDLSIVQGFCEM